MTVEQQEATGLALSVVGALIQLAGLALAFLPGRL
jgi:hypothetical protein